MSMTQDVEGGASGAWMQALQRSFSAGELALFLDVDGTLLEIAQRPEGVSVSATLFQLLEMLARRNAGAVAFVSGRTLADLDRLFGPLQLPAAGLHGVERRDASRRIQRIDRSADLDRVRNHLSEGTYEGLFIEDKGSAIVVHYRDRPELAQAAQMLAARALRYVQGEWAVVPGKMSFELRRSDVNKSDAIREFLAEAPFRGRTPVFFGDDVSDEEAFDYVNSLGGWSVHVGAGLDTCARAVLAEPRELWQLLSDLLAATHNVEIS
jgi:trehalose 6-phosphate phosphatase